MANDYLKTGFEDVAAKMFAMAIRRTRGIRLHWSSRDAESLSNLCAYAYMQGVKDGWDTCEKEMKKQQEGLNNDIEN